MVSLLHPFLNMVVQKSSQEIIKQCAMMMGLHEKRENLYLKLLSIQDKLADAEEKSGTEQGQAMKAWLAKLKKLAYEADDVLDEFQYEAIKKDAEAEMPGFPISKPVRNFFSTSNPVLFRYNIGKRLDAILHKIDEIVGDMNKFGFINIGHQISPYTEQRQTTSVVDESKIVGREEDVNKLVKTVIDGCNSETLQVITIVGMGGLGKTTLAQLIYRNQDVEIFFPLRFWVSVSNNFSANEVAKKKIDDHTRENSNLLHDNMELLQLRLNEIIGSKSYLLVLDDVWTVDPIKWEELGNMLRSSSAGSALIVTSRIETVASIMRPLRHDLAYLNEQDSWTIFRRRAFSNGVEECEELVKIGQEVVRKCGGVPLAIKCLGMLLSEKYKEREWQIVLHSKIWEEGFEGADNVLHKQTLRALKLSYDHLHPHVKQCFAFCIVFPKGYVMDQETLIQLWIANGFIQWEGTIQPEEKGKAIINELKKKYFIQLDKSNYGKKFKYHGNIKFSMHDLMHDLALFLLNNENIILNGWRDSTKSSTHLSHFLLKDPTNLRTFLSLNDLSTWLKSSVCTRQGVRLSRPRSLRALEFGNYRNLTFPKMPTSMKYIRYIHLSRSMITELPEELSTLYHLQTLKLSHSRKLVKLPTGMRYMRSLRHIYINGCDKLMTMPPGLGQLKQLRTLTNYIVANNAGCQITELQGLDLHGKLKIYNLREVKRASDAAKANIFTKKNLDKLLLSWRLPGDTDSEANNSDDVLNALKPHKELKVLEIFQYGGVEFPEWMRDRQMLQTLVELSLVGCKQCKNLPQVGLLPALEFLKLCNMDALMYICDDDILQVVGGNISHQLFPKLKRVYLEDLHGLLGWHRNEDLKLELPQVEQMAVYNCPKLKGMPNAPKCKFLEIGGNSKFLKWMLVQTAPHHEADTVSDTSTILNDNYPAAWKFLEDVILEEFESLVLTNEFMYSNVVREMYINNCSFFSSSEPSQFHTSFWRSFTCLARLRIHNCNTLVPWPELEFESLNCLKFFEVYFCENFTGKPQTVVPPSSSMKETLPVLEELCIEECPELQKFPTNFKTLKRLTIKGSPKFFSFPEQFETLTSLEVLNVQRCESLLSLPPTLGDLIRLRMLCIKSCISMNSLPAGMQKLTALKQVTIEKCSKIDSFPEGLQQRLSQLEILEVSNCPGLARRCKKGEYHHLVSEIPEKSIQGEKVLNFEVIKDIGLTIGGSIKNAFTPSCGSNRQLDATLPDKSYWISSEK